MPDRFRVGRTLSTTIYRNDEAQPVAWVPGDPALASRITLLLNGLAILAPAPILITKDSL